MLGPLLHRHCAVLDDDGIPGAVLRAVHSEQATHLLVGPRGYDSLLDALGPDGVGEPPPSPRTVALGGAPLARGALRQGRPPARGAAGPPGHAEVPGGGVSHGQEVPGTSWPVVVPVDGRAPAPGDLQHHLRDQGTTKWYLPERLELVDALPRERSGKVDEKALRAHIDDEG